jgi:hypothetical protein
MMLKLDKNKYINTDYIVSMMVTARLEDGNNHIQARLIDNSSLNLFSGLEAEMERKLEQITRVINVHDTRVIK